MEIFTDEFLKEIGFNLVHRTISKYAPFKEYGEAKDKIGMTYIHWNNEGHSVTYSGKNLEPNVSMDIRKDGNTRYAFNGYVFNQDDVRRLLMLTN